MSKSRSGKRAATLLLAVALAAGSLTSIAQPVKASYPSVENEPPVMDTKSNAFDVFTENENGNETDMSPFSGFYSRKMITLSPGETMDIKTNEAGEPVLTTVNLIGNLPGHTYIGNWFFNADNNYYNNDWAHSFNAGDSVEYSITGTMFKLYGRKTPGRGPLLIYIDGELKAEVDTNTAGPEEHKVLLYSNEELATGKHTIKLVNKLGANDKNGVTLDYYEYMKEAEAPVPVTDGVWESSDAAVATVEPAQNSQTGKVTAQGTGFAVISLKNALNQIVLSRLVKVRGTQTVALDENQHMLQAGEAYTLNGSVSDAAYGESRVYWKSSDPIKLPLGTNVQVDASPEKANVSVTGNWQKTASSAHFGGSYYNTQVAGSSMSLEFTGEFVRVYGYTGPDRGIYNIYLDDVYVGQTDDGTGTAKQSGEVFALYGLSNTRHTLKLEMSDRTTGAQSSIDLFEYGAAQTSSSYTYDGTASIGVYELSLISYDGMSQDGMKLFNMPVSDTSVELKTDFKPMNSFFQGILEKSINNYGKISGGTLKDKRVLHEGAEFMGYLWLETQPMGGVMYGKIDTEVARTNLTAFLNEQFPNGKFPHLVNTNTGGPQAGANSIAFNSIAQYGLDLYYLLRKDRDFLQQLYDSLEAYDSFLWNTRDTNGNGILEQWGIYDTGEDFGNRFDGPGLAPFQNDGGTPVGTRVVDSTLIMADSYANRYILSLIAKELQMDEVAADWAQKAQQVANAASAKLWNNENGAYYDWDGQNDKELPTLSVQPTLRAMTQHMISQEEADRFVNEHLMNPEEFFTAFPIPSTAVNDPKFENIRGGNAYHSWAGPSNGLTMQRAVKALENYGKYSELAQIGERLFKGLLPLNGDFPVQFDPLTGNPNRIDNDYVAYEPMVLVGLEYLSHLYGVYVDRENISWNGMELLGGTYMDYKQVWYDRTYSVKNEGGRIKGQVNGVNKFSVPNGLRVLTDYDGNVKAVIGMGTSSIAGSVQVGEASYSLTVAPNQVYNYRDGLFIEEGATIVVSVDAVEDVEVEYGTPFEQLRLPAAVKAKLSDGAVSDLDVQWSQGDYNPMTAAVYTLTGKLNPGDNIQNPAGHVAAIKVTVKAKVHPPAPGPVTLNHSYLNLTEGVEQTVTAEADSELGFEIRGEAAAAKISVTQSAAVNGKTTFTIKALEATNAPVALRVYSKAAQNSVWAEVAIEVKKPRDPVAPPAPQSNKEIIYVDVTSGEAGTIIKFPIERTFLPDGTAKDDVILSPDKVKEAVEGIRRKSAKRATIVMPDAQDKVSEVSVKLPAAAKDTLTGENIDLEISTDNVRIIALSSSLSELNKDLFFRLVPIKKESEHKEIEERARKEKSVRDILGDGEVKALGRPVKIETNLQGHPVRLILPLRNALPKDEKAKQSVLDNLAVFVEHSDGTKELIRGEIVPYKNGQLGIQFEISKFSTFTAMHIEGWKDHLSSLQTTSGVHEPYISGFPDGTFGPERSVTRAQMAAMLARNIGSSYSGSGAPAYKDISEKHWAFMQIEAVSAAGLMVGYQGSFRPEKAITRAEITAIIDRWMKKNGAAANEGDAFADVSESHWAYEFIHNAQAYGIMKGYPDGSFKPDEELSRAEAVQILNRLFARGPLHGVGTASFPDVDSSHWAYKEIEEAGMAHQWIKDATNRETLQH